MISLISKYIYIKKKKFKNLLKKSFSKILMTYLLKEKKNIQSIYVCFAINPFDVKSIFIMNKFFAIY